MKELSKEVLDIQRTASAESIIAGQKAFNIGRRLLWGIRPRRESVPINQPGGDDFLIIRPRTRHLDVGEGGKLVLSDTNQTYYVPRVSAEHISLELRGVDERSEWFRDHIRAEGDLLFCLDVNGIVTAGMRNVFDGERALEVISKFGDPNMPIPEEQLRSPKT